MPEIFDLFGDPVPQNFGGRGRPAHMPTQENRNKVSLLLALGWGNERIAAALGVTQPTLRKHYFSILKFRDEMRDRMIARLGVKLWEGVEQGNVGAIKEFRRFVEDNDLMTLGEAFKKRQAAKPDEPKTEKLGKKETANREAQTAHKEDPEWGSLLEPPRTH